MNTKSSVRIGRRKTPVWVTATGTFTTRIRKACFYLKQKAWVPKDPREGDKAMLVIVCNLRRYHQLGATTTVSLIREHYNPRCITDDGLCWGWSDHDILKKYRQVGKRGMYPTLGIADPKAKRKSDKIEIKRQLKAFWKKYILPGGSCTPFALRMAFIRFRRGVNITANMLSRMVKVVTGLEPVRPFGKKFYRGFHLAETQLGLIQASPESGEKTI